MTELATKWTSQRRFIATEWHVSRKWGTSAEPMKCGICRRLFKVGEGARWICATGYRCLNFFVCDDDDTSDVKETWQRITRIAQQDEYDLAARIVQLESDLMKSAAVECALPTGMITVDEAQRVAREACISAYLDGTPASDRVVAALEAKRTGAVGPRESEKIYELRICEVPHVVLRPDQLYRFTVAPDCEGCAKEVEPYTARKVETTK
jgi:hypothetical protein